MICKTRYCCSTMINLWYTKKSVDGPWLRDLAKCQIIRDSIHGSKSSFDLGRPSERLKVWRIYIWIYNWFGWNCFIYKAQLVGKMFSSKFKGWLRRSVVNRRDALVSSGYTSNYYISHIIGYGRMNFKTKVPTRKYNKGRICDTTGMFCRFKGC